MIFATTGTQLPFPRLIAALDALAATLPEPIIAQIGPDRGRYDNLQTHESLTPAEFDEMFTEARVIVAHAGIGTILSARRHRCPLILVPRRADLNEHRNDHQGATARGLEQRAGLNIVWDVADLEAALRDPHPPAEAGDIGPLDQLHAHLRDLTDRA
jgi:UDP-N-acetylglucosamine transferase subunit ALG13